MPPASGLFFLGPWIRSYKQLRSDARKGAPGRQGSISYGNSGSKRVTSWCRPVWRLREWPVVRL